MKNLFRFLNSLNSFEDLIMFSVIFVTADVYFRVVEVLIRSRSSISNHLLTSNCALFLNCSTHLVSLLTSLQFTMHRKSHYLKFKACPALALYFQER